MTYEVAKFIAKNAALSGTTLAVKEVTALNYLVRNLKINGLWPASGGLYPFVGVDAIAHSLNLLDPDSNRISFSSDSSGYHSASGWTPTSGARADSGIAVNGTLANNIAYGFYSRTNSATNDADLGYFPGGGNPRLLIYAKFGNNNTYADAYNDSSERVSVAAADSLGLYTGHALNTARALYKNGTSIASRTLGANSTSLPTGTISLGRDTTQVSGSTGRQYAFFFLIPAITNHSTFYTIIQNFQTILGRNV